MALPLGAALRLEYLVHDLAQVSREDEVFDVGTPDLYPVAGRDRLHVIADGVGDLVAIAQDRLESPAREKATRGELHVLVDALLVGRNVMHGRRCVDDLLLPLFISQSLGEYRAPTARLCAVRQFGWTVASDLLEGDHRPKALRPAGRPTARAYDNIDRRDEVEVPEKFQPTGRRQDGEAAPVEGRPARTWRRQSHGGHMRSRAPGRSARPGSAAGRRTTPCGVSSASTIQPLPA